MTPKRVRHKNVLHCLLAVLLLVCSYTVSVHAVEHPFHAHVELCDEFIAADKLRTGLIPHAITLSDTVALVFPPLHRRVVLLPSFPCLAYLSRAPPHLNA